MPQITIFIDAINHSQMGGLLFFANITIVDWIWKSELYYSW